MTTQVTVPTQRGSPQRVRTPRSGWTVTVRHTARKVGPAIPWILMTPATTTTKAAVPTRMVSVLGSALGSDMWLSVAACRADDLSKSPRLRATAAGAGGSQGPWCDHAPVDEVVIRLPVGNLGVPWFVARPARSRPAAATTRVPCDAVSKKSTPQEGRAGHEHSRLCEVRTDATADRSFDSSDSTVDREGVDGLLSELDEYAVEQALLAAEERRRGDRPDGRPADAADASARHSRGAPDKGPHVEDDDIAARTPRRRPLIIAKAWALSSTTSCSSA